jgi:hypothetical protein
MGSPRWICFVSNGYYDPDLAEIVQPAIHNLKVWNVIKPFLNAGEVVKIYRPW